MAGKLPYLAQPGVIHKIISKIKEAKTPDRFTYDFLETKLGCKGGNYQQFVGLAKKLGLLKTDGAPTEIYKKIRNEQTTGAAMAQAIKIGYAELFERNEFANELDAEKLKGLVIEITGLEKNNKVVSLIGNTFNNLKKYANFEEKLSSEPVSEQEFVEIKTESATSDYHEFGMNLSYTINLVLPKTDDPAVFNAIFKALKENLLRK